MKIGKLAFSTLCAVLLAMTLSACRDDEQGRPLSYNKGMYEGMKDQKLTQDQVRELSHRLRNQGSL